MTSKARMTLALALAGVVALSAVPGHAAYTKKTIATRTYDLAASFLQGGEADPTCDLADDCMASSDGTIDIGGVEFAKIGGKSKTALVKINITDASGTPVYFSLCQDFDGDSSCGESADGDPTNANQVEETSYRGCSPGSGLMTVSTKYPLSVFVYSASTGCTYLDEAEDTYLATQGTITLVRYIKKK